MFDSPFAFCSRCNQVVLLDQTQRECQAEHVCGDIECPLHGCFSGYDFKPSTAVRKPRKNRKERHHDGG